MFLFLIQVFFETVRLNYLGSEFVKTCLFVYFHSKFQKHGKWRKILYKYFRINNS